MPNNVENEAILKWLDELKQIWEAKEIDKIPTLFSDEIIYYESPFDDPCYSSDCILELWKEVPLNQEKICFTYKVITSSSKQSVIEWFLSYSSKKEKKVKEFDGIFLLSLNKSKCTFFKQWWVEKV